MSVYDDARHNMVHMQLCNLTIAFVLCIEALT